MSLVVYKSSAGSGKTHTLVLEYLKITLQNPDKFRNVLAITFTNKAAGEMKERIISTLQLLAAGSVNNQMAASLIDLLNFPEEKIIEHAQILLANIIHHFEDFGISTIDSFVHRVIRTFATDVKLPHGFEVIIDNEDIIPDIVEDLYERLGEENELTSIMVSFVMSLADDEKNYNPEQSLIDFINKQTREDGFEEIKKLTKISLARFLEILGLINQNINKLKAEIHSAATDALSLIETNGLEPSHFRGGKNGITSYFKKNLNKLDDKSLTPKPTVAKAMVDDKWYGGKATFADKATIDAIKGELANYFNILESQGRHYVLLKMVHTKLYAVALIKEIRTLFDDFTLRNNKVHISDFNKKISDSIAGQPTPFIYERLGNRYDHFLIDEFQDTSVLQWYNLLPLIENSLAAGNFNMLVGDAKQAIYRFRGGEVELFSSLPRLYGNSNLSNKTQREKLLGDSLIEKNLNVNYRSFKEIVEFNNRFFTKVIDENEELIGQIYYNHEQEISPKKNHDGYVSIKLLESENIDDYREKRLEEISQYVATLLEKGFNLGDICVLTQKRSDAIEVATYLLSRNIPVISSESLLLSGSAEVRAIVAILKGLLQPDNPVVLAELLQNLLIIKNRQNEFEQLANNLIKDNPDAFNNLLEWAGIETKPELLKQKPIYLLAETIYNYLSKSSTPNIYFQYFLDFIHEKETVFENRMDAFLQLWEQKKSKLFIKLPEGENAVQIMTIHKAKGLKFQVVIVDVQNRLFRNTKDEFWTEIKIDEAPELTTTLLPIQKGKLEAIGFSEIFEHEKIKSRLDFLNLIYVAFTRPVEALFIVAEHDKKSREEFSKMIRKYLTNSGELDENISHYEYGILQKSEMTETISRQHTLLSRWNSNGGDFPVKIAPAEEVYWEMAGANSQRIKGKIIHEVLSKIRTFVDIEKTVNLYSTNGVIDSTEQLKLTHNIQAIVNHPMLKPFFSISAIVKNETEVILPDGALVRPDRVVINNNEVTIIDYKTGEKEEEHTQQVEKYKQAFVKLGYNKVTGMLVYIGEEIEILKV